MRSGVLLFADGQNGTSELFVDNFRHGKVECGSSADDAFPSGNGADEMIACKVANCKQEEKYGQGKEDELQHLVSLESAKEHKHGEESPHDQVPAHERMWSGVGETHLGHDNQGDQSQPEQPVGCKGGGSEGVALLEFHNTGDNLGDTAVEDAHGQNHGTDGEKSCIVDIQQDGGHAESHQAQRSGVCEF